MKKLIILLFIALSICGCYAGFDDTTLNNRIDSLEQRLSALETVMRAYENKLTISSIEQLDNGYIITFSDGSKATITNGKDGVNGKDGADGDTLINSIVVTNTEVIFTLTDGHTLSFPLDSAFAIDFDSTDIAVFEGGQSVTISYTISGATKNTVVKALTQDGWKAQVKESSSSSGTITITAPNPIVESEILVFVNDGSYRTLMVMLNCVKGVITLANNSADIKAEGGTYELKLQTNMHYTVKIPDSAKSWLSLVGTRAVREDVLTFNIAKNTGLSRFTTVLLNDAQDNTVQSFVVRQLGSVTDVYVGTKGGLEKVLSGYDYANMESLKISGVLNDVDFLFIYRMMPKLRDLDIADVEITSLPARAFYNSTNVENIILPKTLTAIGERMFYSSKLKAVTFMKESQVKTIEEEAFSDCSSLTVIEIPASVETIDGTAFKNCSKLTTVTFEKGSKLKNIAGGYNYDKIYYGTFSDCSSLTAIEIPASVETIGSNAFKNCSKLTTVTFEKGSKLKTIGGGYSSSFSYSYYYGAFSGCSSLTDIEIPASVETIESAAFKNCSKLTTVTFEKGSKLKTIAGGYYYSFPYSYYYGAFSDCSSLTAIEIPASVETIENAAFKNCSKLTTVTFEKGSKLKTIGVGYSYYSYYYGAFSDCSSLTAIEIPASVETIESAAFNNCSKLTTVTFEKGSKLKTIGGSSSYDHGAFSGCSSLTAIEIPASVETIGSNAFTKCSKLTTVTFEKGSKLKNIGLQALYSVMTIDMSGCTQVELIETNAFGRSSDSSLLVMIGTKTPPSCKCDIYANPSMLKVPAGCVNAYKNASGWSRFANITELDE